MSSKNIHEEYFSNNNDNIVIDENKNKNLAIGKNKTLSLSRENYVKKSKIASCLTPFPKETINRLKKNKTNITKNSIIQSRLSTEKVNNKKCNKFSLNKISSPALTENTCQTFTIKKDKISNHNKCLKHIKDPSLHSLNSTLHNHISFNSTNISFFKDALKKKYAFIENGKNNFLSEGNTSRKNDKNKIIKKNSDKNTFTKKDALNKHYLIIQKENTINKSKCFKNIISNNNIPINNNINSACLSERYTKKINNKKNINGRIINKTNNSKDEKSNIIYNKTINFSDLKNFNELVKSKDKQETKEKINNKKKNLSILLNNIISDNINSTRRMNKTEINKVSKESEYSINNSNQNNKTQVNINNMEMSFKCIKGKRRMNNSAKSPLRSGKKKSIIHFDEQKRDRKGDCREA
jgi:hypothetical protein